MLIIQIIPENILNTLSLLILKNIFLKDQFLIKFYYYYNTNLDTHNAKGPTGSIKGYYESVYNLSKEDF